MNPSQFMNSGNPQDADAPIVDDEKTMPIGVGGEFGEETANLDPLAGAGTGKKFGNGSLIIVLVIAVAVGGLWGMRKLTRVNAATNSNTEVEMTIEKFLGALTGSDSKPRADSQKPAGQDGVLDVLKETYTQRQVPLTDVQRNPFILYGETFVTASPDVHADSGDFARAKQRSDRQEEFERGASALHLKSVIMGSDPLANVSGKIVHPGDEITSPAGDVAYRVTKITADAVTIIAEDKALDLTVEVVLTIKRFN